MASETCPYWFNFMNHFQLLAFIQSFQSIFTFLADRGLLASWQECAWSMQMVLKERQNTPEWSLIKCQKKVYFNILIVTIRQKGWWSWPVTRKERLIRPTWSIVNYGFAMHNGAIEKLPFCYRPNRPIFVKIQVRKKVNTKLVHTVWLTLLAGCR